MSQERLERLKALVTKWPEEAFPRYALALEYRKIDDMSAAEDLFKSLVEGQPEYVPTYLQYGQLLIDSGEFGRAREILESGVLVASAQGDDHAASELSAALEAL